MRYLITGGSGAFGTAFVEHLLATGAERIVVYSRDEHKHERLARHLGVNIRGDGSPLRFFVGDVRDESRLRTAMRGITHVVHAAALKIVPICDYNVPEPIKTNINGTLNVIDAALDSGVERVVALSSDKACGPVNAYGASKLMLEKSIVGANVYGGHSTKFSVVRYGNVTGSTGSVVPLFWAQAKAGEAITITDWRMTRFFMTLAQAVHLVQDVLDTARGGEVIVPTLPSYRIGDMATAIWREVNGTDNLTGYQSREIGIRPGEKLHESMISEDEAAWTYRDHESRRYIYLAEGLDIDPLESWDKMPDDFRYRSDENPNFFNSEELQVELARLGWQR